MSGIKQVEATGKVYRQKVWLRVIAALFGSFFGVGGVAILINAAFLHSAPNSAPVIVAVMPFTLAIYLLAVAFRPRIVIGPARISVRGAFRHRAANLNQIEGIRARPSRYGIRKQLVLKNGGGSISLPSGFTVDDGFRAWIKQFPDLDRRHREALLAEIEQREDLGATPEQRLRALARARQQNIALMVLVATLAAGFVLGSAAWTKPCGAALALAPVLTAWLCWRWPLFFAIFKRKQDPRAETSYGLLIAAFALLIHMSSFHLLSVQPLLLGMALLAVITVAAYFRAVRSGFGNRAVVAVFFLAALYAYGALAMIDVCFDSSTGNAYAAAVIGRHESHGRSTTYYLRIASWGPVPTARDVSVPASLYRTIALGDSVCLDLHPGRLKTPWFRVMDCLSSKRLEPNTNGHMGG